MGNGAESKESESIIYNVGDYVELQGTKKNTTRNGYIRFKGKVTAFGECVGIELDKKINDGNNGTFNDHQYFECDEGKGTFIKIAKIIKKLPHKISNDTATLSPSDSNESFPLSPAVIEKSEEEQIKSPKKKKKKKKKGANGKDKKTKKSTKTTTTT